ncbi:uncharacterized protein PHALS_14900 [Plasmopara halstedii]|uniref:Uncharacterized protein n=1 Tax=Plasmopara halstedii TaxID=4781 RepID=A0A0N7L7A6_PLAHL|nr:uncharacterized protein PHALS_14900 [Plasmopara halstedii]CEG46539.1 hypothetical protein PHALS_14900 [Plasmopara halstedii]|eukprot:XP_024582908.1 hypothetical protein PHALS_14900 [Plasmopara halstedii]
MLVRPPPRASYQIARRSLENFSKVRPPDQHRPKGSLSFFAARVGLLPVKSIYHMMPPVSASL